MAQNSEEEEDDYLSMTFSETPVPAKETSLQRTARLKKEALERSRIPSKAERLERDKAARDTALATSLDTTNKGAQMMAKMGFKGGALGQSEDARTQPIELLMKDDKGGIGMDSEKKRKVREAAEEVEKGEKRQKVGMDEFRERNRSEREERRAEGLMWGAMKVLEGFEVENEASDDANDGPEQEGENDEDKAKVESKSSNRKRLRDVNVLYQPLVKQRLEKDRDRKMRHDLNNSLSTRNDAESDDEKDVIFDERMEDLEDEDPELQDFEGLAFAERLEKIVHELRDKYYYCFWCKFRYPDAEMDGCPGSTEDEHG